MNKRSALAIVSATLIVLSLPFIIEPLVMRPTNQLAELGISYPGAPALVYGPLFALTVSLAFAYTRRVSLFPIVGVSQALFLGFVMPGNLVHLGSGLGGLSALILGVMLLKGGYSVRTSLPMLTGLYTGMLTAGNLLTMAFLGPIAFRSTLASTPQIALVLILTIFAMGSIVGILSLKLARLQPLEVKFRL